ncbi:NADH dehydrogenase [ubiquinone] 1 alpha subcomplex assembly factor 2 isoform X2 [Lepisosteus oculatus]|uniref:NADH dehydrogenase [ubiquinone] 1 alpha subcomplex assembly factor 2 isoform X2 n=1 Tax=Lepisosteus oculatus TaxID=7918 RepID=UPI00073FCA64|nr:PREDICTED: mimitin, mitochondrial isoform X2 [Lepisosteus oculatus]
MSRIVALIRRKFAIVKQHVGTDHFGNKYYFIPEQKTWTAWIRGRKKEPPTIEELLKNERYRDDIKARAKEVADREMALRVEEQEEGLVARPAQVQIKGHASARRFELTGPSEDPTSTANTFEPGSWKPSGDNTKS